MMSQMHLEKRKGLVIEDWYFGEGMEFNSTGEKVKKGKTKFCSKISCEHTVNGQTNKH